jgi:outer membrane lipase/esterase
MNDRIAAIAARLVMSAAPAVLFSAAPALLAAPAQAQSFSQMLVFGDSSVDSGFYKVLGNPGAANNNFNIAFAAAIAAGGTGAPTNSPGLMNSQVLAAYFGLTANPANQPGGTNFATSGAKDLAINDGTDGGFTKAIPVATQIDSYLAASGGRANGSGLYLISSGGNDVNFAFGGFDASPKNQADRIAYLQDTANGLADKIAVLHNAGARTIIVPGLNFSFAAGDSQRRAAELAYTKALWSGLAERGVNFIPGDFNAVRVAIAANPSAFGFQFVGSSAAQAACTEPVVNGVRITTAYALLCISNPNPADPAAQSHLKTADAAQTHLFADDQHLTTAGQKLQADYYYSLIVAPSEISFLAENAVQSRTVTVAGIQDQIGISRQRQTAGFNVWINGDVSSLKIDNPAPGFPGDPSTPLSGTVGLDYKWASGYLLGAAITMGTQTPGFELGGSFRQKEIAGSVYGSLVKGSTWANVIGTYGALRYDVNRIVPIGITMQGSNGVTNGSDVSLAAQAGYDFVNGTWTHGPVAGLTWQQVKVGGFTETGGFTALSFGDQTRDSVISALGYKATYDLGQFRPFVQAVWNHELGPIDRTVRAALTTIDAPSYEMPAVKLGRDWATATIGTSLKLSNAFTGLASFTAQAGQTGVTTYGGRVGVNYRID